MPSEKDTLTALTQRIRAFAEEREWEPFHTPKNLAMALAAEAAELMEHFLWCESADSAERLEDPARRERIAEELADIFIYTLRMADVSGLDLAAAAERKIARNAEKYPVDKARGNARKYDEL